MIFYKIITSFNNFLKENKNIDDIYDNIFN